MIASIKTRFSIKVSTQLKLATTAGLVLVRQRPGTAKGVYFTTIEVETGVANLVIFRNLFENTYRKEILHSKLLMVEGKLQKEGSVIHVIVSHCEDWSKLLRSLTTTNNENLPVLTLSSRDENNGFPFPGNKKNTGEENYSGRTFA